MSLESSVLDRWTNLTIRVKCPNGSMFVCVMENPQGQPVGLQIFYGKAGTAVAAWAQALSRSCTLVLENGGTINQLISEFSEIKTDRSRLNTNGAQIRSDVEGFCAALIQYRAEKSKRDHGDIYAQYRPPRLGRRTRSA